MPARPPYPPSRPRPSRLSAEHYGFGSDPRQQNRRSIAVGVTATIVVHLLLAFLPASVFRVELEPPPPEPESFEIELTEPVETPPEPDRPRYVETNPNAPENEPDETANESDRNQQPANEVTPEELSPDRTPAREGEEDVESNKIVDGSLEPMVPATPPAPASEPAPEVLPTLPGARQPLAGPEDDLGEDPENLGTSKAPPVEDPEPVEEPIDEEPGEDVPPQPHVPPAAEVTPRPTPAPRPRVVRTPPGPVRRQDLGVSQTGYIGVDARFSQFGEYMARMIEAVSQRWHELHASRAYSERGTMVVIRFTLTRDGNIRDMETVHSTARTVGEFLCRSALEQGQSYGPWTEEMVRELGDEDVVTFRFYYR